MDNLIEQLACILPIIAIALLATILVLFKFRTKFPIKVNCWFCNNWTQVSYQSQNSWTCPNCQQYNGFDETGDYNKIILEQYCSPDNVKVSNSSPKNGLCTTCNNNQLLKITQLADFKPVNENKFDKEVDQFKEKLEKLYALCPRCENILNQTLIKQKSWLFGLKLSYLKAKGQSVFKSVSMQNDAIFVNILRLFLFTMSIVQFCVFISDIGIPLIFIRVYEILFEIYESAIHLFYFYTNNYAVPLLEQLYYFINLESVESKIEPVSVVKMDNAKVDLFPYSAAGFRDKLNISSKIPLMTVSGVVLQIFLIAVSKFNRKYNFLTSLLWISLVYMQMITFKYIKEAQIIVAILNMFSYQLKEKRKPYDYSKYADLIVPEENELNDSDETASVNSEICADILKSNCFHKPNDVKNKFLEMGALHGLPRFETYRQTNISEFEKNSESFGSDKSFDRKSVSTYKSSTDIETSVNSFGKLQIGQPRENRCASNLHFSLRDYSGDNILVESPTRPKPVLTPPRLRNISQASWVAGGYWKPTDEYDKLVNETNFSRSSSQSSGFGSQLSIERQGFENVKPKSSCGSLPFDSVPPPRDDDIFSVLSEPSYCYNQVSNVHPRSVFPHECRVSSKPDCRDYRVVYDTPCCNGTFGKRTYGGPENVNIGQCVYGRRLVFGLNVNERRLLQPAKENLYSKEFNVVRSPNRFSNELSGWEKGSLLRKWNESFDIRE